MKKTPHNEDEHVDPQRRTRLILDANGSIRVDGPFELVTEEGDERVAMQDASLCRCGRSGSKPFCDTSHRSCHVGDPGVFTNRVFESVDASPADEPVRIVSAKDGPLVVEGPVALVDSSGEVRHSPGRLMLCGCGKSFSPPFCDGRHRADRKAHAPCDESG